MTGATKGVVAAACSGAILAGPPAAGLAEHPLQRRGARRRAWLRGGARTRGGRVGEARRESEGRGVGEARGRGVGEAEGEGVGEARGREVGRLDGNT